jgi:hypothetical protein
MFSQKTVKIASVVAIILSIIGLLLSIVGTLLVQGTGVAFFIGCISWAILTWASIIGYKVSSYKLYAEDYKKIGIRIYAIILSFLLFFFVGLMVGLIISVALLATLWGLKSNYAEWIYSEEALTTEITADSQTETTSV